MLEIQNVSLGLNEDKGVEILKEINLKFFEKKYMLLPDPMVGGNLL